MLVSSTSSSSAQSLLWWGQNIISPGSARGGAAANLRGLDGGFGSHICERIYRGDIWFASYRLRIQRWLNMFRVLEVWLSWGFDKL